MTFAVHNITSLYTLRRYIPGGRDETLKVLRLLSSIFVSII